MNVLVVAEEANPEWVSVPLVGWSHARALCEVADVHIVTQVRNQAAILRYGLTDADFSVVDNENVVGPLFRLGTILRGGKGKGWTTLSAFKALAYYSFESLVWQRFEEDLREGRFDIVHRITPLSPTVSSTLARRCKKIGVPFVLGPLNGGVPWPKEFRAERHREREWLSYVRNAYKLLPAYRSTRRDASAIMVASRATEAQLSAIGRKKSFYVPENGVPERDLGSPRVAGDSSVPLKVVFAGRLVPYKGADMLLEAASDLLKAGLVKLTVIGDGPDRLRLERLITEQGLTTSVSLLGWLERAKVLDQLRVHDVFASPSVREFGGGAVLEAMAVGAIPLIVDYAGPSEIVTADCGVKVPIGSRPEIVENLRVALKELCEDRERIARMSSAGISRVRRLYTWETKARQTRQIYDWVLGKSERPDMDAIFA